ncbi:MAG: hypothetical protein Q3998_00125 [Porphyromonas sp.]|nr:hypothetical protein [Porphyromonas sp.]
MHILTHNRGSKALRFRRWSRKAYAVFMSVGRVVTIGTLRSPVAERLLMKSGKGLSVAVQELLSFLREPLPDEEEQEKAVEILCFASSTNETGCGIAAISTYMYPPFGSCVEGWVFSYPMFHNDKATV